MLHMLVEGTPAQRQVLALAALGKSKDEICTITGCKRKTVTGYLRDLRKKNGVIDDYQLIAKAKQTTTGDIYV